jgi:sortase A
MSKRSSSVNKPLAGTHVKLNLKRHLLPPLAGLFIMLLILGFFNSQLLAAQYVRHFSAPEKLAARDVDIENRVIAKDSAPKLIISSLGIETPIDFSQQLIDENSFQVSLRSGVVHYPATALPGNRGNVVVFGHSSGQVWAPGEYKFIFAHLDELESNDKIFLEYEGTRYIYRVTGKQVVKPEDVSVLEQTGDYRLTLITCTPVGTNNNRLIVSADQIVPKPADLNDSDTPATLPTSELEHLSPYSPSLWESIKSLF